jgi:hypothetical protein
MVLAQYRLRRPTGLQATRPIRWLHRLAEEGTLG